MRLTLIFSSLWGVWGGLRDAYCFGGANPNFPIQLLPIKPGYALQLVQVVTRHGARTPLVALPDVSPSWTCAETSLSILAPNDGAQEINVSRLYRKVYLNHESYQQCAFGQLTVLGAQQHAMIGEGLRAHLVGQFLSPNLTKSELFIRATDYERTQQSVQSLLLLLYPPQEGRGREVELLDINTITSKEETMVPNFDACPYLYFLREQTLKRKEWVECVNGLEPTIRLLQQLLGEAPQTPVEKADWLESAADTFSMIECHNNTLPANLTQDIRQKLYDAMDLSWWLLYNHSMFSELTLGGFLLELYGNMEAYVNASASSAVALPKLRLYSGHDTTLAPLLGALGNASTKWIPPASQIVLQLLQNSSSFAVRVLFNGQALVLPGCTQEECAWSEWSEKMKQLRGRLDKANKFDDVCQSVAVTPACRDIVTILKENYAAWWPLLLLLFLSCLVILGCSFRVRRLQKVERFRPVEMAEVSESR